MIRKDVARRCIGHDLVAHCRLLLFRSRRRAAVLGAGGDEDAGKEEEMREAIWFLLCGRQYSLI